MPKTGTTRGEPPCGHPDCGVSTGVCDTLTFGRGELCSNGYWEFPCEVCEAVYHARKRAEQLDQERTTKK